MRQLLKKNAESNWTPSCQKELDYLKGCLTSRPILKPIDFNRDMVISCDASIYGIGYAIMQADDNGMLHAVRYVSYTTTLTQANYSAEDLNAVGLMYALKYVEWLAQCRHVTVLAGITAVLHISDRTPRNRRQRPRRMLSYIMQFNLTVLYIRGSSNTLPDCFSRLFQDASPEERRDNEPKYLHQPGDFILPVITRSASLASLKATDRGLSAEPTNEPNAAGDNDRSLAPNEPLAHSGPDADGASSTDLTTITR